MKYFNHNLSRISQNQRGFSMVELMVALVLSTLLIGGIIQLFIGTKQTYRFHEALSRIQENGRFALDSMSNDIRMAGYNNTEDTVNNPIQQVNGANGNDGITLRWTNPNDGSAETRIYEIRPGTDETERSCAAAATSINLDRRDNSGSQELIEGVQRMQLLYGVCDTNGVVQPPYVNAAGVGTNWDNVCSVRIHLLLVSMQDRVLREPQTVFFPPDTDNLFPVNDLCLRQAFSTTVAVRNRILSTNTNPPASNP